MKMKRIFVITVMVVGLVAWTRAATEKGVVGKVRVQLLSPKLVRLEERGKMGFEDRNTFLVVERKWSGVGVKFTTEKEGDTTIIKTPFYEVRVLAEGRELKGVEVRSPKGESLYKFNGGLPSRFRFPEPHQMGSAFSVADSPRVVPPRWGATPVPEGVLAADSPLVATSGWDFRNDACDIYVFVRGKAGYVDMRKEYLRLTGPIPLPPLFVLGFWDSRYHPYEQKEALDVIDRYRKEGIPLDVFVVDTNWRKGGSDGYDIETKLFPDMPRFLREAHARNVKIMFNDHPVARAKGLDPVEMQFRWEGLTKFLKMGIDFWWYDKNWPNIIQGPIEGIDREVWGQRVYYDIHSRLRPGERPLVMSMRSEHPAGHRYPIWWTGDIHSTFSALKQGVADSVGDGVRLLPWVNQDLGGHFGNPSPELYVRFVEWGCLSPVTRVHCTLGRIRYPWVFGEEAQGIVTNYAKLRYRLLPTLYAAARRAFDDGTPLLRRCDLEWPEFEEARSNLQYLLGDDILIAPVVLGMKGWKVIPSRFLIAPDGKPGLRGEYFIGEALEGKPVITRVDPHIDFRWGGAPASELPVDSFSVRWMGKLGPVPMTGQYTVSIASDDGVRLWLDGKQLIDDWSLHPTKTYQVTLDLEAGKSYDLQIEYFENVGWAVCELSWLPPIKDGPKRSLWIPPGAWENAWTGEIIKGPKTIEVPTPLWLTPMFVRRGGLVLLAPEMQYSWEKPWEPVTVEAFPPASGKVVRELYEDDRCSLDYQKGEFMRTRLELSRPDQKQIELTIDPAKGKFPEQIEKRGWIVRLHLLAGERATSVKVDGKRVDARVLSPAGQPAGDAVLPMPLLGAGSHPASRAGPILEIEIEPAETSKGRAVSVMLE